MFYLPHNMTKQEQHNEWHSELRVLCNALVAYDKLSKKRLAKGVSVDDAGDSLVVMFRQHFAKVSLRQGSDMDAVLGYDDMVDYAKWYVSGEPVI